MADSGIGTAADHTATEQALSVLWRELLGQSGTPDSTFIALGGDSVAAAVCTARIRSTFGVNLPLDLLLRPDIRLRDAAAVIDRLRGRSG